MAFDEVRSSGEFAENVIIAMVDAIMSAAVDFIQTIRSLLANNAVISDR